MSEYVLTDALAYRHGNRVNCCVCGKHFEVGDKLIKSNSARNKSFYCVKHYYAESDTIESKPKSLLNKIKETVLDFNLHPVVRKDYKSNVISEKEIDHFGKYLHYDELEIAYYKVMGIDIRPNIRRGID